MASFCVGFSQGSSLKRECVATDVNILPVLLSANLPAKTWNMQIVYIFISTAGECSPAMLFLALEPQGKDERNGARGLSPHCWHGLAVPLCPLLPPFHALALAVLFLCPNIPCLSCPNLCSSSELLAWHCLLWLQYVKIHLPTARSPRSRRVMGCLSHHWSLPAALGVFSFRVPNTLLLPSNISEPIGSGSVPTD